MRNLLIIILGVNLLTAKEINVSLTIVDHTGKNLPDAQCIIQFNQTKTGKSELIKGTTNIDGIFSTKVNTLENLYVEVTKTDYYQSRVYDIPGNENFAKSISLIPKLNPNSLYVKYYSGNSTEGLKFPGVDQWYNYDLKIGDWTQPNGRGVTSDLKMRLHCDEKSLTDTTLELEANEDGSGFYSVDEIISYSELKLPHQAPENNYVKRIIIRGSDWESYRGLFLKSRVQLDKEGKIISANYGKIQGAITINRQGTVGFTHYFNATPNDRNLEFDPSRNLLKSADESINPQFEP